MTVVHSFSFTPATACPILVTVMASLFTRRGLGVSGNSRLFMTQNGVTTYSETQIFPNGAVTRICAQQAIFSAVGGSSCTVGIDATMPGIGGYQFSDIHIKAEQIKR